MNYDFRFDLVLGSIDSLLVGAWLTVRLSVTAMAIGMVIATFAALGRTSGPAWLRAVIGAYVEVVRNTPFLVQIFIVFFGLPAVGVRLSPNASALLAMVLNVSAYATEILRAGIESIPRGQIEAGKALGLTPMQVFRYIVVNPALKAVYPALTSQYVLLMLQSSVVSAISAEELTAVANDLASSTFASFEVYILVTVIYFALGIGFSALFSVLFRRLFAYADR